MKSINSFLVFARLKIPVSLESTINSTIVLLIHQQSLAAVRSYIGHSLIVQSIVAGVDFFEGRAGSAAYSEGCMFLSRPLEEGGIGFLLFTIIIVFPCVRREKANIRPRPRNRQPRIQIQDFPRKTNWMANYWRT